MNRHAAQHLPKRLAERNAAWTVGNLSLHYQVRGSGPATLVLIHELGGSMASWEALLPLLEARCTIISFDQRGHGLSEKVRQPFSVADQVDDLDAVLTAAGQQGELWLIGAAAGAAVAVAAALRAPARVAGLILCAPAVGADAARRDYLRERTERAERDGMRAIVDASFAQSYPPAMVHDPAVFAAYRHRFLANDPVSYGLANLALGATDLSSAFARIACPCLLLAGTHDLLRPPALVRELAAALPGSDYDEIESGHLMAVQAPALLAARILAWVDAAREAP